MAFTTTADLVLDALKKAGEKSDGTSSYTADALTYIDALHLAFLDGGNQFNKDLAEPWTWAKSKYPFVVTLQPAYVTGTVAIANSSTSGTFTPAPAISQQGNWIQFTNEDEFYLVSSHIAGQTNFTIDSPFVGANTAAITFQSLPLDYNLDSTVLRPINAMNVYQQQFTTTNRHNKIESCDFRTFSENHTFHWMTVGVPTHYTVVSRLPALTTVRFNKFVATQARVEYDFIAIPAPLTNSALSIPLLPVSFREVLSFGAAYKICVNKSDDRAKIYFDQCSTMIQAMINAERKIVSQNTQLAGQLIARQEQIFNNNWPTFGSGGYP